MPKVLGVDFAPLSIPLPRRLQTLSVIGFSTLFLFIPLVVLYASIRLLLTPLWWLVPLYGAWFLWDYHQPQRGSRRIDWVRRMPPLKWFVDYFPISLRKTVDLPADRNYLFGYHPHGILAMGAFANFATEATGFSKTFPGLQTHLVTLVGQFMYPLRRELIMATGAIDSSRESIDYVISHPEKGKVAVIVVGGASEVLNARPGQYNILMSRRKGFIRMALERGVDLVPVYSFGENDVWHQVDNDWYHRFENFLKKVMGYPLPVIYGRGMFNYTFGFMPFRHPIVTVIGRPIRVERITNPTAEEVSELHARYCAALSQTFEENKADCGVPEDAHLNFI